MTLLSERTRGPGVTTTSRLSRRAMLSALPLALAGLPTGVAAQPTPPAPLRAASASGVALSGVYSGHLQGVCTNDQDAIYWSMTTQLMKTDVTGTIVRQITIPTHHGDLCHLDGRIYVAVNLGLSNDPQQRADSWIYVYDAGDLALLARHKIAAVVYGAGGLAFGDGRFIVVGGLPDGVGENHMFEYDKDFSAGRRIALKTGHTYKGVQTAAYDGVHWWFGCYGKPAFSEVLIRTDRTFGQVQTFAFDASTGIVPLDRDTFLIADSTCGKESCVARLAPAKLDAWIEAGRLKPIS